MTDREHTRPLKTFRGLTDRPQPVYTLTTQTWDATVTVTPLKINGREGTQFEIAASWHGPPLPGTPTPPPGMKIHVTDTYMVADLSLARAVCHRAQRTLAEAQIPDLRAIAEQVLNDRK